MQDLRLVLIILGLIAIVVLIVHGLWANKKNQVKPLTDKPLDKLHAKVKDNDGFDIDGIGSKRVISSGNLKVNCADSEEIQSNKIEPQFERELTKETFVEDAEASVEPSLSAVNDIAEQTYIVPLSNAEDVSVEPETHGHGSISHSDEQEYAQEKHQEIHEEIDEKVREVAMAKPEVKATENSAAELTEVPEEQVFVINVMARENQVINGAQLLQELLTLGFKFGEMDIFHRHVDGAGKGAVIFSLANMVKPGTFDIDNMEQFQTPGVSLFMMYPCAIPVTQNYNMMLTAADRIASAIDGLLCDASRNPLTAEMIAKDKACVANIESKVALQL